MNIQTDNLNNFFKVKFLSKLILHFLLVLDKYYHKISTVIEKFNGGDMILHVSQSYNISNLVI